MGILFSLIAGTVLLLVIYWLKLTPVIGISTRVFSRSGKSIASGEGIEIAIKNCGIVEVHDYKLTLLMPGGINLDFFDPKEGESLKPHQENVHLFTLCEDEKANELIFNLFVTSQEADRNMAIDPEYVLRLTLAKSDKIFYEDEKAGRSIAKLAKLVLEEGHQAIRKPENRDLCLTQYKIPARERVRSEWKKITEALKGFLAIGKKSGNDDH